MVESGMNEASPAGWEVEDGTEETDRKVTEVGVRHDL